MKPSDIPHKNKLGDKTLFKISRFKEKIKKTSPHKHEGYHELIFLSQGEGFHWVETKEFKVTAPELYFLRSGQVHHWQFTAIPRGFVLLFKEEFFDPVREAPLIELIRNFTDAVRILLPEAAGISFIFEDIFKEYQHPTDFSDQLINGYLRALFSKMLKQAEAKGQAASTPTLLHDRFLRLIAEKCPELHTVRQFAVLLNTSPQNLNAACRKHTQKSAGEHIAAQLLLEAKRYILHTEKSIGEIADLLHFNDASYFIKFFKRYEKRTPLKFREQHFG